MGSKWEIFPCGEMVCDPPNVCWRPKKYDVPLEMCLPPGFSFDALPERLCFERAAIYIFAFWHTIAALAVGALLAMLVWCLFSRRRRQVREFVRNAPGRMTRRLQEAVDHLRRQSAQAQQAQAPVNNNANNNANVAGSSRQRPVAPNQPGFHDVPGVP